VTPEFYKWLVLLQPGVYRYDLGCPGAELLDARMAQGHRLNPGVPRANASRVSGVPHSIHLEPTGFFVVWPVPAIVYHLVVLTRKPDESRIMLEELKRALKRKRAILLALSARGL
jgi:hypothetical protein